MLCKNYWEYLIYIFHTLSKKKVILEGEYQEGKKIGKWNLIWDN